jgi:hypothetical protein
MTCRLQKGKLVDSLGFDWFGVLSLRYVGSLKGIKIVFKLKKIRYFTEKQKQQKTCNI